MKWINTSRLTRWTRDLGMLTGLAFLWRGLHLAWPPLAWIVIGLTLCGLAVASLWTEPKARK